MSLDDLVRGGELDELMLEVDRRCASRDWDALVTLRDRCLAALEFGRQLWGVAQFAEYRLALEAPGPYAASVCRPGAARFTLGPLTEVAASTHTWEELADHLPTPWAAATVAQERVLRGEDLRGDPRAHAEELELPLVRCGWEPAYPLPRYRSHDVLEGGPSPVDEAAFVDHDDARGDPTAVRGLRRALRGLVAPWVEQSEGRCDIAVVAGGAGAAAAAVAPHRPLAEVPLGGALERVVWAAASGGTHGRRRGMAAGRGAAFWLGQTATGLGHGADVDELGERLAALRWYAVGGGEAGGWQLRLAVEDPGGGWAAAIVARDEAEPASGVAPGGEG